MRANRESWLPVALGAALVATWLDLPPWAVGAAALSGGLMLLGRSPAPPGPGRASAAELLVRSESWGRSGPPEPLTRVREE